MSSIPFNSVIRKILANTGWNMMGLLLPLVSAIIAIPILITQTGTERFGILSLIWVLVGYFALFDLGLGRAVTKLVSEFAHTNHAVALTSLCWTTVVVTAFMGCLGGLLAMLVAFACWPLSSGLSEPLRAELPWTIVWVGLCIPVVALTSVFKGILEGEQRFGVLNLIRGPTGALLFLLPAAVSMYDPSLAWSVGMTFAARMLMLYAHYMPCRTLLRKCSGQFSRRWVRPLFEFGGWFTVSNLVGPIIVYMDRFMLAMVMPLTNIAYYTAPFEVVSKLLNIPVAITAALFPTLNQIRSTHAGAAATIRIATQVFVFFVMALIVAIGVGFSQEFIVLWLGESFVAQSTVVMQILLVGFAFNALAQVTYVSLQSEGQNRMVAYLHLCELPVYGVLLWWMIELSGIEGAALAWAIRSLADWLALEMLLYGTLGRKLGSAQNLNDCSK